MDTSVLKEQFKKFHHANPHFYELFKRFSFEAINAGRTAFSARMILHRMRWYTTIETNDLDYKVNNNHSPYYARMFMNEFPKYKNFFRTRIVSSL